MRRRESIWENHSLSIVLSGLFLLSLAGHALSGWQNYNNQQVEHGAAAVPFATFLVSSEFGETVFENWESEFLQMACYVILTVFLYQRGSVESKTHDGSDEVDEDPAAHRDDRARANDDVVMDELSIDVGIGAMQIGTSQWAIGAGHRTIFSESLE